MNFPVNPNNTNNLHHFKPPPKKKFCFKEMKNNTICSLKDVEFFLNNFQNTLRYIKLFKLLK